MNDYTPIVLQGNPAEQARQAAIAAAAATSAAASAAAALAAGGPNYASAALGLAATSLGDTFAVDNGDGTLTIYSHDAGPVATALRTMIKEPEAPTAAALIGYARPGGLTESAGELLDRLGMSPASFGAAGDGAADDSTELSGLASAIAASAWHREIQLDAKSYAVGDEGGWVWSEPNGAFIRGRGMSRTTIAHLGGVADGSAFTLGSTQNLFLGDLTLAGSGGYAALYAPNGGSWENIVFHRVRFTAQDGGNGSYGNGLQWVIGTAGQTAKNIWLIDCEWADCDRMGAEFQNQIADTTHRFGNLYIVRPRISRVGAAGANGMGISLTGYHDGVLIDRPFFDDCPYACVELVGASRTVIRDMLYVPDDVGTYLLAASNTRPMYGNKIDGVKPVTRFGQAMATLPQVGAKIGLDNFHDGEIRGVKLNSTAVALDIGANHACDGLLVTDNVLQTSAATLISHLYSKNAVYRGNKLTSTYGNNAVGIAFSDNNGAGGSPLATNNLVDGNVFDFGAASPFNPLYIQNSATARFTDANHLVGHKVRERGQMTITAGTAIVVGTHSLGAIPDYLAVAPNNNSVLAGGVDTVPYIGADAVNIAIKTHLNLDANAAFFWEARKEWGNL